MRIITRNSELRDFCDRAVNEKYITIDTEFLRERTYFSKLCLIQLAFPGNENENAVIVDTLVNDLDLSPLYECTHNFHIFKKNFFVNNKKYWGNKVNDPYLFVVDFLESLDIDTEKEFSYVEKIYKSLKNLYIKIVNER